MPVKKQLQRDSFPLKQEYLRKSVEWNVKAIHGERQRKIKGRNQTQYLVEWEPDPDTGETFDFDWRPSNKIGWEAKEEWKRQQEGDQQEKPSKQPSRKRQREESVSVASVPSSTRSSARQAAKRRRHDADLEVALPSKLDLNPDDYDIIGPSQLASQTTIPDSQENPDSFPSAAATAGDQEARFELRSPSPAHSIPVETSGLSGSPDQQQDFQIAPVPSDLSSPVTKEQLETSEGQTETLEEQQGTSDERVETGQQSTQREPSQNASELSTLQSTTPDEETASEDEVVTTEQQQRRQSSPGTSSSQPGISEEHFEASKERAEINRLSFGERQVVTTTNTQQTLDLPPDVSTAKSPSVTQETPPSQGFLTQPELEPESLQPLETSPPQSRAQSVLQVIADSNDAADSREATSQATQDLPSNNIHSAQIVLPLSSVPDELGTPSQRETEPSQRVIPASSLGQEQTGSSSATAARSRSVPSDAIVCETPARRAHSTSGAESSAPPSQLTADISVEHNQALVVGPHQTVTEEVPASTESRTVDAATQKEVTSFHVTLVFDNRPISSSSRNPVVGFGTEPVFHHSIPEPISPDSRPANPVEDTARSTPTSCDRNITIMDPNSVDPDKRAEIDAAGVDEGNLTNLILGWHAKSTPSRFDRSPTPSDHEQSSQHTPGRRSVGDQSQHGERVASDHVAHPSLTDGSHFANPLGLDGAQPRAAMPTEEYHLPATIAPSQLDMFVTESHLQQTLAPAPALLFQSHEMEHEEVLPGIESRQPSASPHIESQHESSRSSSLARSAEDRSHYMVTLPMLASTRVLYTAAIKSNQAPLKKLSEYFLTESAATPDRELVAEVDDIFRRLYEYCDLPQFNDSIPPLDTDAKRRHSTGTNAKYAFAYELFMELRDSVKHILVVSQQGVPVDNFKAICQSSGFYYTKLEEYDRMDDTTDGLTVIISTSDAISADLPQLDAVILFDSAAREAWKVLGIDSPAITIDLAVANSIEHIDMVLTEPKGSLERRAATGFALASSLDVILSPRKMPEPHDLALMFANFIKDPAEEPHYAPYALPESFFDSYLSPQSQRTVATSFPNGRKRGLTGPDDRLSTPTKRARTAGPSWATESWGMSDLLKDTLTSYIPRPGGSTKTIELPIDQLEWMVGKISHLENELATKNQAEERLREVVKRNEAEITSHRKTIRYIQPKYKEAISERGISESQAQAAEAKVAKLQENLAKSRAETDALREKLISRPASDLQSELDAAVAKSESLDKKLVARTKELDYFRDRIQSSNASEAELRRENEELTSRVQLLERQTGETLVRIHQTNADSRLRDAEHDMSEKDGQIAQLQQHSARLEGVVQDLRSNRRETRSGSVPRSPRLGVGVMSPRTTRGGGGGGGATSRGTSPAATPLDGSSTPSSVAGVGAGGMSFYQPPGSHPRFSHLRE
ncbi:hypothetical protein GE09DRAFT_1146525 [Coniochaeta sp. 2T2.1]|nr:hypothetical protein GE09DRAFT_1146525 [Coniochaeta sp. 2T2.1]